MKVCIECGKEKDESEFYVRKETGRLRPRCKKCQVSVEVKKNKTNPEKIIIRRKRYEEKHPERVLKAKSDYVERNREKINEKHRDKRRSLNPEAKELEKAAANKYYQDNKEWIALKRKEKIVRDPETHRAKIRKKDKARLERDPNARLIEKIRTLFRVRLKYAGVAKINSTFSYTGVSMDEYMGHLKNDPLWSDYENKAYPIHVDHIIGCILYDFDNPEDIKKCWNPRNLRLLPASENLTKSKKFLPELVDQYQIHDLLPNKLKSSS